MSTYFVRFRLRVADVTPELEAIIKAHGPYGEGAGPTGDGFYEIADAEDAHAGLEDELVRRGIPFDRVLETDDCDLVRWERRFRPAAGGEAADVEVSLVGGEAFVPTSALRSLLERHREPSALRAELAALVQRMEPVLSLHEEAGR
ncbi:MAG: hypothetical protein AB1816_07880 [Bacillota bacterium]